ncbi:MAG TPA: hypothetical protein VJB66_03615 [Candidatus Nanoarchaeia archaeon]|nr:hypothetical protein [Candidatus Nanoarchaeia archaeon]
MAELSPETITDLARRFYAGDSNFAKNANITKLQAHLVEVHPDCTLYVPLLTDYVVRISTAFFTRIMLIRVVRHLINYALVILVTLLLP